MVQTPIHKTLEDLRQDAETKQMIVQAREAANDTPLETKGIRISMDCVQILKKHRMKKPDGKMENWGETASRLLMFLDQKVWPIIHADGAAEKK